MDIEAKERTERRLSAILAADVVGYSRLMGVDEEGTHFALKAVRREVTDPKIDAHRGRIVKTTGDGLLVEFASVVDAVRCAVDIQREMKWRNALKRAEDPIVFRIGINLGDIILDEADIFGDGVNVAARLEGLADPGGICVSRIVRDQVRDKLGFGFEDLGPQHVKNIARPVHVFRIPLDAPALSAASPRNPDPVPTRRGVRLVAVVGGSAAVLGAILLVLKISPVPVASPPSPIVGDAIFFSKDKVVLSQSAGVAIRQQAAYLRDNPNVTITVQAYCSDDEGAREGPRVLAELRANQVRDALEARGIAAGRIKVENACHSGRTMTPLPDEATAAQSRRAVLIRN
jgi:class 3 adenylate cyclase/outer membrane protein OmpA-like peptidoglycan-associated protein